MACPSFFVFIVCREREAGPEPDPRQTRSSPILPVTG
jgi:hypothetical protein